MKPVRLQTWAWALALSLAALSCQTQEDEILNEVSSSPSPAARQSLDSPASITSFSPANGYFGTTVIITGTGFIPAPEKNKVFFGQVEAVVTAATTTELTVTVPFDAVSSSIIVNIGNTVTVISPTPFAVTGTTAQTINSLIPDYGLRANSTGFPGDTIIIRGGSFNSYPAQNHVWFGNAQATVLKAKINELTVLVPRHAQSGKVVVQINTFTAVSPDNFRVIPDNQWVEAAPFPGTPRVSGVSFVIGEKIYYGLGHDINNTYAKDFWEYNTTTNTWTQKADVPFTGREGASAFALDTKGYVVSGRWGGTYNNECWEYNSSTDSWTRKADFPGTARVGAAGFALLGSGFVGSGVNGTTELNDFYRYANDGWYSFLPAPASSGQGFCFVIGWDAYVGYDASGKFWKMPGGTFSWNPLTTNDTYNHPRSGFSIGTKGYATNANGTSLLQYNPLTNTWANKGPLPTAIRYGSAAAVGNFGYLIGGMNLQNIKSNKVYRYIPD